MNTSAIQPSLFPHRPDSPFAALSRAVRGDEFWEPRIKSLLEDFECHSALHLAILVNPWLQRLLDGRKTVESRFSVFRQPPFGSVEAGDVILLKRSGGPVLGVCQAAQTRSYVLNPDILNMIRNEFSEAIGAPEAAFWNLQKRARYATLITMKNVRSVTPFAWQKKDRRGWVVIRSRGAPGPVLSTVEMPALSTVEGTACG